MTEMAVPDSRLVQHLRDSDDGYQNKRPYDDDYYERFRVLHEHMNKKIHPHTNTGAAAATAGSWFTDHGPGHIETVIRRIEDLVYGGDRCVLSPYDTYLVLVAAHFHDVGMVYGRDKHEEKLRDVMFGMEGIYVGNSAPEKRMICDIAMAHGGIIGPNGSKDTIGHLRHDRPIKRLAAILRFADEISDDSSRTGRFIMDGVQKLAPGSEVFHLYAERLTVPPSVRHDTATVKLSFELLEDHLANRYRKLDSEVYLLDEIMERTLKTHREQVYCTKFMGPDIVLERTEVEILVCSEQYRTELGVMKYVLGQGYPEHIVDIRQLAPQLSSLTGQSAAQHVERISGLSGSPYESLPNLIPVLSKESVE